MQRVVVDGWRRALEHAWNGCARLLKGRQMAPASHEPGPLAHEGQGVPESFPRLSPSMATRPWRIRLLVAPGSGVLGLARVLPSKSPQLSTASCAASIGTSTGRWEQGDRRWPCRTDAALAISDPEMHLPPRPRGICRMRYSALLCSLLMVAVTANWGRRACH
jgi:hypothetical protein